MENYLRLPKKTTDCIFYSNTEAIQYLLDCELIPTEKTCEYCAHVSKLIKDTTYVDGVAYRCINLNCRKRTHYLGNSLLATPRVQLYKKFLAIYEYLSRDYEKRVLNDTEISKSTFQLIKKNCIKYFSSKNEIKKNIIIGGEYNVQIDETVIYKGKLIMSPSQMYDNFKGCTWLVGLIEEGTGNIILNIVPNRKIATITSLIQKHVKIGTLIITDGYPSYPNAVKNCLCSHEVVNHSKGFKNNLGFHTNNIENLWSLMKYEEKKRLGIKKSYINSYLEEFIFRYYNLRNGEFSEIGKVWYEVIFYMIYQDRKSVV